MLACIGYIVPEFVRFPGGLGGWSADKEFLREDRHVRSSLVGSAERQHNSGRSLETACAVVSVNLKIESNTVSKRYMMSMYLNDSAIAWKPVVADTF